MASTVDINQWLQSDPIVKLTKRNTISRMSHYETPVSFLYQLTKMLTDDNSSIMEWKNGRIVIHDPPRLESDVLIQYFRTSNFSSFQRQLNYFGFRKIEGIGHRMTPCSYVNDATTMDIRSLTTLKKIIKKKICWSTLASASFEPPPVTSPTKTLKRKVEETFAKIQQFQEIDTSNKKQKQVISNVSMVPYMTSVSDDSSSTSIDNSIKQDNELELQDADRSEESPGLLISPKQLQHETASSLPIPSKDFMIKTESDPDRYLKLKENLAFMKEMKALISKY